ncbi:hypothetical protein GH714_006344 [Hevea brasiliensis]|uniref:Uncharacterized protein n=1 Tax=Hevea brasiliensis TaxID=3981 RepID=A0A6A6N2M2_HEVBR|nr:hypothetical protein GH714_006344 [Hevea brasiliensis]
MVEGENEDNLSDGLVNEPHVDVGHHENEQPILGTFDGLGSLNVETRNQNHCNYDFDSYVRENVNESDVGYLNGVGFDVGVSDNLGRENENVENVVDDNGGLERVGAGRHYKSS